MLSYALLKGARLGYLDAKHGAAGRRAYAGMLKEFIEVDAAGVVNIHHVCQVAGLGGDPEKESLSRRHLPVLRHREDPQQRPQGGGPLHLRQPGNGASSKEVIQVLTRRFESGHTIRETLAFGLPRRIGMSQRKTSVFRAILALACVAAAGGAGAQDYRGSIAGTITDSSGGVLPGATVVVTNEGTRVAATVVTDAKGYYRVLYLNSGTYTVSGTHRRVQDLGAHGRPGAGGRRRHHGHGPRRGRSVGSRSRSSPRPPSSTPPASPGR